MPALRRRPRQAIVENQDIAVGQLGCGVLPVKTIRRVGKGIIAVRAVQLPLDGLKIGAEGDNLIAIPQGYYQIAAGAHGHRIGVRPAEAVGIPDHALAGIGNIPSLPGRPDQFAAAKGRVVKPQFVIDRRRIRRAAVSRIVEHRRAVGKVQNPSILLDQQVVMRDAVVVAGGQFRDPFAQGGNFPDAAISDDIKQIAVGPALPHLDGAGVARSQGAGGMVSVIPYNLPPVIPRHNVAAGGAVGKGNAVIGPEQRLSAAAGYLRLHRSQGGRQGAGGELSLRRKVYVPAGAGYANPIAVSSFGPQQQQGDGVDGRRRRQRRPKPAGVFVFVLDQNRGRAAQGQGNIDPQGIVGMGGGAVTGDGNGVGRRRREQGTGGQEQENQQRNAGQGKEGENFPGGNHDCATASGSGLSLDFTLAAPLPQLVPYRPRLDAAGRQ